MVGANFKMVGANHLICGPIITVKNNKNTLKVMQAATLVI